MANKEAVEATVTGHDQQVGFRALVMKQAIEYNLAGSARNDANETVHFTLQGDKHRIDKSLASIQAGTKGLPINNRFMAVVGLEQWCSSIRRGIRPA